LFGRDERAVVNHLMLECSAVPSETRNKSGRAHELLNQSPQIHFFDSRFPCFLCSAAAPGTSSRGRLGYLPTPSKDETRNRNDSVDLLDLSNPSGQTEQNCPVQLLSYSLDLELMSVCSSRKEAPSHFRKTGESRTPTRSQLVPVEPH
jgi:hypothetical protein